MLANPHNAVKMSASQKSYELPCDANENHTLNMITATASPTPNFSTCKKICGIYAWEHIPTRMLYIGSSLDRKARYSSHKRGRGHFHRSAKELGWNNFTFMILEECLAESRFERERDWIHGMDCLHPAGFNIQKDPTKYHKNYVWTDKMKEKQSAKTKAFQGTPEARSANAARKNAYISANPEAIAEWGMKMRAYYASNKHPLCKAINQYDLAGKFIATFESTASAAKSIGANRSAITNALKSGGKSAGYRWRHAA